MFSEYRYISEDEFRDIWGARAKPTGDLYFHSELKEFPPERVWTVFEGEALSGDNSWYASPGIALINAIGYLVTDRPWDAGTHDAIWYLDDEMPPILVGERGSET